jgi:phage tail P2-like protein
MNNHGLIRETLVATLPAALQKDPSAVALAEAMADLLARRPDEIEQLRIYPVIDRLDARLLDILAYDFKVDWWDADYSLEEKRRTLKDSWRVHKLLGTKAAVEMAISAIYPRTTVLEWWEYGGEPYHFRLDINITNDSIDSVKQRRVLERLEYYKSLRSHNDGVTYFVEAAPAIAKAVTTVAAMQETAHIPLTLPVPIIKPVAVARVGVVTGLWESAKTRLELPTPTIQRTVTARIGVATGLWEAFTTSLVLTTPPIQRAVIARARASAGWEETFIARVTLPEIEPPRGEAEARAGIASAWQESYTTPAVLLTDEVQTAAAQAQAKSAVVSMQETAQTFINL